MLCVQDQYIFNIHKQTHFFNHKETNVLQQILDKQGTSKFVSTYWRISIVFRSTKQNVKGQELV